MRHSWFMCCMMSLYQQKVTVCCRLRCFLLVVNPWRSSWMMVFVCCLTCSRESLHTVFICVVVARACRSRLLESCLVSDLTRRRSVLRPFARSFLFFVPSFVPSSALEVSGQLIALWLHRRINFHTDDCFTRGCEVDSHLSWAEHTNVVFLQFEWGRREPLQSGPSQLSSPWPAFCPGFYKTADDCAPLSEQSLVQGDVVTVHALCGGCLCRW